MITGRKKYWDRNAKPPIGSSVDFNNPFAKGLVGCWLLNESGGRAFDLASGNTLISTAGGVFDSSTIGGGLRCDANNKGVYLQTPPYASALQIAKAVTMYWRGMPIGTPTVNAAIASCSHNNSDTAPYAGYQLYYVSNTINFGFNADGTFTALNGVLSWTNSIGNEVSVAVTCITGKQIIYRNGISDATGTTTYTNIQYGTTWGMGIGLQEPTINRNANTLAKCVYIWNRVLSASELRELHFSPFIFINPPKRRSYKPAASASGPSSAASIGSRLFDGANSKIDCGSASMLDNLAFGTAIAWCYPTSAGEGSVGRIIQKGQAATGSGWRLYVDSASINTLGLSFRNDFSITPTISTSNDNTVVLNQWNCYAVTWLPSGLTADIHMYKNGIEVAYKTQVNAAGSVVNDSADDLFIGNSGDQASTFAGNIAHVQLFSRVLTAREIQQAMAFPGSISAALIGYWPLWGANPEGDYSGKNNTGTLTSMATSTLAPPISRMFLKRRPRADYFSFIAATGGAASKYRFRKTLSGIGTKTGSRQVHDWSN